MRHPPYHDDDYDDDADDQDHDEDGNDDDYDDDDDGDDGDDDDDCDDDDVGMPAWSVAYRLLHLPPSSQIPNPISKVRIDCGPTSPTYT